MALFVDLVVLSNGLHGSVQMDLVALFSWIGWLRYRGILTKLFDRYKVEEQAYKGCMSLLKLSDKYGKTRLENACQLALDHISQPGYKNIKMILQSNQDLKDKNDNVQSECDMHAFVRGKDYYGGKNNG